MRTGNESQLTRGGETFDVEGRSRAGSESNAVTISYLVINSCSSTSINPSVFVEDECVCTRVKTLTLSSSNGKP